MRRSAAASILIALAFVRSLNAAESAEYKKAPGPAQVEVHLLDWLDESRSREIPSKIYLPASSGEPAPVIVFSHGLGGSRDGYEYLGRHWASHGYVSVHLQHEGSDDEVWKGKPDVIGAMRDSLKSPGGALHRPFDVKFAIDELARMNETEGPFKNRFDLDRIGVAGHSYGAYTTLAIAGQGFNTPRGRTYNFGDPRVKAAIPMSAPPSKNSDQFDKVYSTVKIPCFHMTGTHDTSVINDTTPEERRIPFDYIPGPDQYLVTFEGGDHMIFSGRLNRTGAAGKDPMFQDLIEQSSTAFWDAYLREDPKAKAWLIQGGFDEVLGENGVFEKKLRTEKSDADRRI